MNKTACEKRFGYTGKQHPGDQNAPPDQTGAVRVSGGRNGEPDFKKASFLHGEKRLPEAAGAPVTGEPSV